MKEPSPVRIGMKADEVLKLRGRGKGTAIVDVIGRDDYGLIVNWKWPDCTATLAHSGACYRVMKVEGAN